MAWFWQRKRAEKEQQTAVAEARQAKRSLRNKVAAKKSSGPTTSGASKQREMPLNDRATEVINAVLLGPVVTEKAARLAEGGTYVFEVARTANKVRVAQAVAAQYRVHPTKVNVVNEQNKATFFAQRPGHQSGMRKAYVTLKSGESIELFERS